MIETLDDVRAGTSAGTFDAQDCGKAVTRRAGQGMTRPARVGDWLVEPGPPSTRMWRWGRITAVLPDGQHLVVRWYRDSHNTVVLPSPCARIESADHEPRGAGDAVGRYTAWAVALGETQRWSQLAPTLSDVPARRTTRAACSTPATPLTQPLEVGDTRAFLRERVVRTTAHPQMPLRIGWPYADGTPPRPTPRRPLTEVVDRCS